MDEVDRWPVGAGAIALQVEISEVKPTEFTDAASGVPEHEYDDVPATRVLVSFEILDDLVDEDGRRIERAGTTERRTAPHGEFKATAHRHADGNLGDFKVYKRSHSKIVRAGGWYGFAVYRRRGTGTQILRTKAIAASSLPVLR
ncbi:hypothetical protein [Halosolutus gelatinilyticus]|uniref:hypothetical protein n=1 Tax=Halosolutus gelatinilyticus TaxID=2931975 RepID=UPI003CE53544